MADKYEINASTCKYCGGNRTWEKTMKSPNGKNMPSHVSNEGYLIGDGSCPNFTSSGSVSKKKTGNKSNEEKGELVLPKTTYNCKNCGESMFLKGIKDEKGTVTWTQFDDKERTISHECGKKKTSLDLKEMKELFIEYLREPLREFQNSCIVQMKNMQRQLDMIISITGGNRIEKEEEKEEEEEEEKEEEEEEEEEPIEEEKKTKKKKK